LNFTQWAWLLNVLSSLYYVCTNQNVVIYNICNLYTKKNLYGSLLVEKSIDNILKILQMK